MGREYAMRQDSYFRPDEWKFLEREGRDVDVQALVAKGEHAQARSLLSARFKARFTEPSPGETEEAYRKRRRGASKDRKANISRIGAETREQWEARMATLNDVSDDLCISSTNNDNDL